MPMCKFEADIAIIGINPYVLVPENILSNIFKQAGKDKGPIPIKGKINKMPYSQTLVKYRGLWRLYINTKMVSDSPKRIGESIKLTIEFDPADRAISPHPKLVEALDSNKVAKAKFENLAPSLRKEIVRYIANLKSQKSVERNVKRAINFLLGKERFIGRDRP